MVDFKETEFNSSVATLKRIDALMMELHKLGVENNTPGRLSILRRLKAECNKKLTSDERKKCVKYEKDLVNVELDTTNKKVEVNVYCVNPEEYKQKKLVSKWNNMIPIVDEYELYVIGCLDDHGMLMKNKQEVDETPDSWED